MGGCRKVECHFQSTCGSVGTPLVKCSISLGRYLYFPVCYENGVEHLPHTQRNTAQLSRAQLSIAQHSVFSPAQSSNARACRSERDNTSKPIELTGEPASRRTYFYLACSQQERRIRNLPSLQKYKKNTYTQPIGVMAEGLPMFPISVRYNTLLLLSMLAILRKCTFP